MSADWLSILVAVIGVTTSALVAYLAYSLNRQSQRAAIQHSIGELYDQLMTYRTNHPEVMKLCYQWKGECYDAVYRQADDADRQWAIYYTYVELICGFSNAVLYGRKNRLLDRMAYENHYKPLVKLLLTEHYPFVADAMTKVYLSAFIREFIHELEKEGWDWGERHKALIGPVPFAALAKSKRTHRDRR